MTYHPDCHGCCAVGRCHWCAKPGSGLITGTVQGLTYRACPAHLSMFEQACLADPRRPPMDGHVRADTYALTPATLR